MTNDPHNQSRRDTIHADRDVIQVGGDYVGRDKITHNYQQMLHPVPFAFRPGVQRMVEDYTAIFGGRDSELAQLDTFLTKDERPFGLLIAPTGRGKTALLIHWLARVQQHADWRVVFAPISIRYQTASEQVALNLLAHTLAEVHNDLEQFRSYDQSPASLRALVGDYLRRPLPDGVRLLVVLDGLDEATGWQVSRELFPRTPDPGLKIVVAARDMAHRTRATWYRDLGFERRLTCDLELEGLSQAAVRDLLQRMGNPLDQLATDVDMLAEVERVSQGDPVTLITGVQCYGQRVVDLDLVVLVNLNHTYGITTPTGQHLSVRSLCLTIDVKNHPPEWVRFDGNRVSVKYRAQDHWHDATEH